MGSARLFVIYDFRNNKIRCYICSQYFDLVGLCSIEAKDLPDKNLIRI